MKNIDFNVFITLLIVHLLHRKDCIRLKNPLHWTESGSIYYIGTQVAEKCHYLSILLTIYARTFSLFQTFIKLA
jgi:hypothetical protein